MVRLTHSGGSQTAISHRYFNQGKGAFYLEFRGRETGNRNGSFTPATGII